MAQLKVFTLDNLTLYDELIKGYVDAADAKSLKTVAIDGNTLKFYRVSEPVGETTPAYEITLPQTKIDHLMSKLTGATVGNVVTVAADGEVADGGVALVDLATKSEVQELADGAVKDNADAIAAINDAETGILKQAKDHTDALANGQVKSNKEAIEKLNGDAETEGSVAKAVADAKTEINATIGEVEDGKTLVEMITDAQTNATYDDTEIKKDIEANAKAIEDINNEETGILAQAKAHADSKDEAIQAAKKAGDDAQADVDALAEKVGEVEEGKTLVGMIAENAQAIKNHEDAIDEKVTTLIGEDTNKSVRTIANEELAKQLIADGAKESLDTLQEIAQWIQSHPEDASAMSKAIDDLEALVGTLPEDITATDIVGYIAEAVAAEKTRAEGVESGLDTRLKAVEAAVGEDGDVAAQIDNKIAELDADVTSATVEDGKGVQVQVVEIDGKVTNVVVTGNYDNAYDAKGAAKALEDGKVKALEEKVGDGFVAITPDEINALFNK